MGEKERGADKYLLPRKVNKNIKKVILKVLKVLKKYNVKKAGIFGSYSRGEQKGNSDIDIIIETPKGMGIKFVSLNYDLEDALNKEVDLITYKGINPRIKKYILNDEIRII
ncbi:MAG: nucleotidyltransferase family protein [Nanoarchaeota archaeon]